MKEFRTTEDILDFAINSEQESADFYTKLAAEAKNKEMQDIFKNYANEELEHKEKIIKIREDGEFTLPVGKITDLKIDDYLVDVNASPDISYQDALILAMNKEKAAFRLYLALSGKAEDPDMKQLFLSLAQEESKHKLRFEIEYDECILREN